MRRVALWACALLVVSAALTVGLTRSPAAVRHTRTVVTGGYDVSWPQCSGTAARHMPTGNPAYLVLGLTDGRGHTVNPCLGSQLSWANAHGSMVGAYLVPTYPTRSQRAAAKRGRFGSCGSLACRLRNDGAAQVIDAMGTMHRTGVRVPMVWLDVEVRHTAPWTRNRSRNREVLEGMVRTLRSRHVRFGVYSTSYMWHELLGGYRLDVPNWLPVGSGSSRSAGRQCAATATGGRTWMVQYTRALDHDLTCPVLHPYRAGDGPLMSLRRIVAPV